MAQISALYEEALTLVERCSESSKEQDSLLTQMAFLCQSKEQYKCAETLFEDISSKMNDIDDATKGNQLLAEYDAAMKRFDKIDGRRDKRYLEFEAKFHDEEDEDIQTVQANRQVIDPISKKRMVNPVKNQQCGHSYEKDAAFELIKMNPRTRCPMMGCSTNAFLTKKDLVPDLDLKHYLSSLAHDQSANISGILLDDTI